MTSTIPGMSWDALADWQQEFVKESAEWLITKLQNTARRDNTELSDWDEWLLRSDMRYVMSLPDQFAAQGNSPVAVAQYTETFENAYRASFGKCVRLVRSAITRDKRFGGPTTKLVRGLSLPNDWLENYMAIYNSEMPWVISPVMQDAFLGHVPFGEKKPWRSP